MEMEIEIEEGNGKVNLKNSCMVLSIITGLDSPKLPLSVVQKLYVLIQCIAPEFGQASFLESVEVIGHMHI